MSEHDLGDFENMIIPSPVIIRDSISPPKVDYASLQKAMNKNKESLKVKLMTRRPINQLVDQGILPSLKVTPHFYEQRQKLERAKTGDFLKNKIQRRPDRQALIEQHILEDTTADPSLHDKQRQLKKARLADDLNDRLSHRPGPLELVKGNILQADEKFAQAVKEGQIQFKPTCEGQSLRHPPPSFVLEEDSSSDIALSPPQENEPHSFNSLPSIDSMVCSPYSNLDSPTNVIESKVTQHAPIQIILPSSSQLNNTAEIPQRELTRESPVVRVRKKSKPKSQPKQRTIKFHEYKGPPSALKISAALLQDDETSYELLLKQQQLFLQWQLEWQQKYPQILLPVPPKNLVDQKGSLKEPGQDLNSIMPVKCWSKLEDMKVSDLRAELKKRNLPVSGPKPQLIERLKPYSEFAIAVNKNKKDGPPSEAINVLLESLADPSATASDESAAKKTPLLVYNSIPAPGQLLVSARPASASSPMDVDVNNMSSDNQDNMATNENIVKLQQKRIEELQRELQRSQLQLQQHQWLQQQALLSPVNLAQAATTVQQVPTTLSQANNVDPKALQKLQQHLQQRLQQQQLLQQLQSGQGNSIFPVGSQQMSAAVKANLAAFIHNQQNVNNRAPSTSLVPQFPGQLQPILLCNSYAKNIEKARANSLPNGIIGQRLLWTASLPNFSAVLAKPESKLVPKPLPNYNEATKTSTKPKQESSKSRSRSGRKSVKSQAVDDVLEILIKNGELPPSAAQLPPTPTTPETSTSVQPPVFPPKVLPTVPMAPQGGTTTNNGPMAAMNSSLPSSVLQGTGVSLDFDFQLDLHDIEPMDLGVLDHQPTNLKDSVANCNQKSADVDMELNDWLENLTNGTTTTLDNNQSHSPPSNGSYNNDPMLSHGANNQQDLANNQESYDLLFALEDMEFKPSNSEANNILGWDKVDFAT